MIALPRQRPDPYSTIRPTTIGRLRVLRVNGVNGVNGVDLDIDGHQVRVDGQTVALPPTSTTCCAN
jgi:hypothetical protein